MSNTTQPEDYINFIKQLGQLATSGISVSLVSENEFEVDGFYKSGNVKVNIDNMTITSRYNQINSFSNEPNNLIEKLTDLNHEWWASSQHRHDSWNSPNSNWIPFLTKQGFIEEEIITTTKYTSKM